MTPEDREQYSEAIKGLDEMVNHFTNEAHKDDSAYEIHTAMLIGQIGALAKAVLLLTNLLLDISTPLNKPKPTEENKE